MTVQTGKALILRTCKADMTSRKGFKWPREGKVAAPDWKPTDQCGNGLHGFLWGEGDGGLASWSIDAIWLVAEIDQWIDLVGKVKFPEAKVLLAGNRKEATDYIIAKGARGPVIGCYKVGGDGSTLMGGYYSTLTGGDRSTLSIAWHDGSRYRIAVGYVGEDGIKPDTPYRVEDGKFVEVEK